VRGGATRGDLDQFVHVGRQPVYDRQTAVVGYELLFRSSQLATRATQTGTEASSRVIVSAFTDFGLDQLVDGRLGFVNLTRDFLVGHLAVPFDTELAVLEVLETVDVDTEVVAGVAGLAAAGYRIALDDFEWGTGHEELLPLASYVKLKVAGNDQADVRAAVRSCRRYPHLQLIAERLETDGDLQLARDLGFDLFQGYLLGRPQVLSAAALSPSRMRRLELLGLLGQPEVDFRRVMSIVMLDPALSFRMLRATSSAAVGRRRPVSSVHEAMVLLGTTRLVEWLSLMAISDLSTRGDLHLVPILSRARMCQLVATGVDLDPAAAFTAGMLLGVGDLLATPLAELSAQLPLTDAVAEALVSGTGRLGAVLTAVRGYERGRWPAAAGSPVNGVNLARAYLAGLDWATSTYRAVLG
jgi:EAL and modified HD-GYP domain-containing signal transduction protein